MLSEFKFLENLKTKYALEKIGDDCAVLPKDSKTDLVITTDLLVEDIDFRMSWTKPEYIGHKALAVSLSDVAAMGAKPVWSMVSIGVPEKIWQTDFVERFYEGYMNLAKIFGVELVGGDTSKTPDKIVVDSIVAGEVKKNKAIFRSGAKPGDFIFVTGELGGAAAGLKLLENGERFETVKGWRSRLISRQLEPYPSLEPFEFQKFTKFFLSSEQLQSVGSMIDISDGLSSDLRHICHASQVGAKIYSDKIPVVSKILDSYFENFQNIDKFSLALNGGEDFELLFTVNPKKIFQFENSLKNGSISCIGKITSNVEIIELIRDKNSQILEPKGFRHF